MRFYIWSDCPRLPRPKWPCILGLINLVHSGCSLFAVRALLGWLGLPKSAMGRFLSLRSNSSASDFFPNLQITWQSKWFNLQFQGLIHIQITMINYMYSITHYLVVWSLVEILSYVIGLQWRNARNVQQVHHDAKTTSRPYARLVVPDILSLFLDLSQRIVAWLLKKNAD